MATEVHDCPVEQQIRQLLEQIDQGDSSAMDKLLPLLFDDLRRLARAQRKRVGGGETLRTTALIHEAYLKMRRSDSVGASSRRHFLHTAALAMRQILIDHARSQLAAMDRHQLASASEPNPQAQVQHQARRVLDIAAALDDLDKIDPRLVNVVNYRYFAGYSDVEIADLLEVSTRTVRRDWLKAKAWLATTLRDHDESYTPT